MWYGALAAVVVVVIAGVGGYVYLESSGALGKQKTLERAAVVFSSTAEDGAQLAQVIALVTDGGAKLEFIDPTTTATVPGTSYTKLGDAYPFGGAKAVAEALAARAGGPVAYVDVPEKAWASVIASGGVGVSLPRQIEVFDGTRMASFRAGESTVTAGDVPLLLQGAVYLSPLQRAAVIRQVGVPSLRGLGTAPAELADAMETDLGASAYARLRAALALL
jgi:hypothetical protein